MHAYLMLIYTKGADFLLVWGVGGQKRSRASF